MLAAKPLEVKLFRGRNLLYIVMPASGVPGGTARRPANVVLICRVAGNLPLPPPIAPQNANQFLPDTPESPFAQREQLVPR